MSRRILIVDDVDHLRAVLRVTLEFKGHEVAEAGDGSEALAAIREKPFDLIICDIMMPVMDGIEFVRQFRATVSDKTPIIMLTAEGDEALNKALAAGATASLKKPFEPIGLFKLLDEHLGASS